ncbi:MAG: beta-lactamase family protein [Maribacter sp.]|nr:beta-lactamase family protein [Maribacter sp.]
MDLKLVSTENVGISTERLERMELVMSEMVEAGKISGIEMAIMRKGQLAYHSVYGKRDIASNQDLEKNDLWRIYSMTKPIVSVGLMMLYEEGKFQLNDPLHYYIPEFKEMSVYKGNKKSEPAENHIRVIDILRHTSGLGYGWSGGFVDTLYYQSRENGIKNTKEFVQNITKIPLYQEPGTGWQYGVSTDVCGYLIEVLSGMPLDKYLKSKIFDPLQMGDTFFEVPDDKDDRLVTNYTYKDGQLVPIDHPTNSNYTKEVTFFSGGGGLVSSTSDYLKFCQMLLNGGELNNRRLLGRKTVELMTMDHTKGIPYARGPVVLPMNGNGFGLGFSMVNDVADSGIIGSKGIYGWGGAAGTVFRIDPEEELIYIMMIQLMPYNHLQAREKFQTLVYQSIIE